MDWKNPQPGWYYFIFSRESTENETSGYTITTPFVLVATLNQAKTSTVYNVVTNQATQTLTSVEVTQVSTNPGLSLDLTLIAGIAIILMVFVVLGILFRSRRVRYESG